MTEIVNNKPPETEPPTSQHETDLTVVILAVAFMVMTGLGMFLGNVFETYHNGSSL